MTWLLKIKRRAQNAVVEWLDHGVEPKHRRPSGDLLLDHSNNDDLSDWPGAVAEECDACALIAATWEATQGTPNPGLKCAVCEPDEIWPGAIACGDQPWADTRRPDITPEEEAAAMRVAERVIADFHREAAAQQVQRRREWGVS